MTEFFLTILLIPVFLFICLYPSEKYDWKMYTFLPWVALCVIGYVAAGRAIGAYFD